MMEVLKHWFTEHDNQTHDLQKVLAVAAILSGLGCQFYSVYKGQPFDMQAFGVGIGALFGGLGVVFHLKKESGE